MKFLKELVIGIMFIGCHHVCTMNNSDKMLTNPEKAKNSPINFYVWNGSEKDVVVVRPVENKNVAPIDEELPPKAIKQLSHIPVQLGVWTKGLMVDGFANQLDMNILQNEIANKITQYADNDLYIRLEPKATGWDFKFIWANMRLWNSSAVDVMFELYNSTNKLVKNGQLSKNGTSGAENLTKDITKIILKKTADTTTVSKEIDVTFFQKQMQQEKTSHLGELPFIDIVDDQLKVMLKWEKIE